ncbi:MAG: hypothetical protein ACRDBG_08325 [Waterburya sp.]
MNIRQLKTLAKISIEKHNKSIFPKSSKAIIQVMQEKQLPVDYPLSFQYIGMMNGKYIYNLEAEQVLKSCERLELEWQLKNG